MKTQRLLHDRTFPYQAIEPAGQSWPTAVLRQHSGWPCNCDTSAPTGWTSAFASFDLPCRL